MVPVFYRSGRCPRVRSDGFVAEVTRSLASVADGVQVFFPGVSVTRTGRACRDERDGQPVDEPRDPVDEPVNPVSNPRELRDAPREIRGGTLVEEARERPPVSPAVLTIIRNSPDDVQDRWIRIFIDDSPEQILRYGEVLTRELAPGRHRIRAHNTLSSHAIDVDAHAGEQIRIRCHNTIARGGILMMLTTGFAFIKVRLERELP
jgi:hypothetical protein